ncbi:cell growth regulator with RING finger domain protein 1 isoform X3 [Bufo gargarizans]|uniref:cell growth regulator with RING finger domain protein 1 isoform X3 n=1 Tax=Bufo gargarizans TaxID=30331 RepID=UPI001CF15816|nr:cell growth regulator with RING finger domain protein 1 isoform X3 [Bufo gargarizans]
MGKKGCEGVFSFCYVADGARLSGAAMPAIFLATLYEYSPLFYITVVSICFVVTCGIVLGWRGLDVPVILRNSAETASNTFICKKQMQEVKNPFGLEIVNPDTATLAKGVTLRPHCLEKCILSCYWGCSVQKVQEALQKHVYCFQIQTPGVLEDALYSEYLHKEQHIVPKQSKEEILIQLPEDNQIEDFGPVPRTRYPLVALLTMADVDDREFIVSMLTIIHIPDRSYRLPCRIMYQYLLTAQGQFYDLKQLYMSVSDNPSESVEAVEDNVSMDKELLEKLGISEEELQESSVKDCVVCQNDSVNWVLLPCRHVCLCDGCLMRFQHCPICRHFVQETFPLRSRTPLTE